jgi:hypothetical protein
MFENKLRWSYPSTIYLICHLLLIISSIVNIHAQKASVIPTTTLPNVTPTPKSQAEILSLLDPVNYIGLLSNKTVPGTKVILIKFY